MVTAGRRKLLLGGAALLAARSAIAQLMVDYAAHDLRSGLRPDQHPQL